MRLRVEVVPLSTANLGILVVDEATREPIEPMTVLARRDVVTGRNYVLDRGGRASPACPGSPPGPSSPGRGRGLKWNTPQLRALTCRRPSRSRTRLSENPDVPNVQRAQFRAVAYLIWKAHGEPGAPPAGAGERIEQELARVGDPLAESPLGFQGLRGRKP